MGDPSWLGLNRWWFLAHNFPLGAVTQEALQSLREWQMSQCSITRGRGERRSCAFNKVRLCRERWKYRVWIWFSQRAWCPWPLCLLSNRWVCCIHFKGTESFFFLINLYKEESSPVRTELSLWKEGYWWMQSTGLLAFLLCSIPVKPNTTQTSLYSSIIQKWNLVSSLFGKQPIFTQSVLCACSHTCRQGDRTASISQLPRIFTPAFPCLYGYCLAVMHLTKPASWLDEESWGV